MTNVNKIKFVSIAIIYNLPNFNAILYISKNQHINKNIILTYYEQEAMQ